MSREYTAKQEGYVYMYVSNESPTQIDAYFDDVTITYTPTNIIQYSEFYPFGLNTESSWTRENVTGNNYQYNESTEKNPSTGYYDLFFRNFDPTLGRFMQVDPMSSKYASITGYNYAFNSPIIHNDPAGDDAGYRNQWASWRDTNPQDAGAGAAGHANSMYGSWGKGGGWVLTVGNLRVDYNKLPDGEHHFKFVDGQTSWEGYSRTREVMLDMIKELGMDHLIKNATKLPQTPRRMVMACLYCEDFDDQTQGGEYADNSEYLLRTFSVDVKTLGWEFLSGTGPERSMFMPNHPFISDLKGSFILERAIAHYKANYRKSQPMRMYDVTVLEEEADMLRSPIEHFLGSARISIIPMKYGTMYQIDNTTDRHSGSFDTMDPKPRDPNGLTPTGTIYQRFIWVEWNK